MFKLNPEQQQAVEHGEGPLLIIAGPGSGKTRVITQRIVHLLGHVPGLQPENILALTFTEKAAGEMKSRVARALPDLTTSPQISTFHSFAKRVLENRRPESVLLDKIDVWIFLRRRMAELGLGYYQKLAEPGAFLHDLNEFFSRCQDELIEPEDFEAYVGKLDEAFRARAAQLDPADRKLEEEELVKKQELARVFRNSRKLIQEAGGSSLGTLIPETIRLFDREPGLRDAYRARFRYVLVDEFQDTNYAQVELLKRLIAPPSNLTAVGDDDQAIYRFRGASHGAFKMFGEAFPGHKTVYLSRNYRSTQRILRAADAVIAKNDRYEQKPKLQTEKEEGSRVYLLQSADYASEAAWIAEEIERLARRQAPFGDIAVLYRAHSYRDPLVEEFRRREIPFSIRGLSILSTIILRDLLAYLNVVHSPHDNISLTRVLLMPRWNLPEKLALEVRAQAARHRCSLYDVLESWEKAARKDLAETGWPALKDLLKGLRWTVERSPVTALFKLLKERLGLDAHRGPRDGAYMEAFEEFLKEWEKKSETRKLGEFMEYFSYFREAGGTINAPEPAEAARAVQMMTVHAAKGLEFPVVFILSVAPQRFPHREQKPVIQFPDELRKGPQPPSNIHLQEERRLFYVALTRAQERLYVSSVSKTAKRLSPFIDDLTSNPVVASREIETLQAPHVEATAAAATLAPPRGATAANPQQSDLFENPQDAGAVHPPLAAWAGQPPAVAPGEKLRLSATSIEDYQSCPLKFKFSHYLKVPTGPQPALTFGNLMHQCVRRYFELRKAGPVRWEDVETFYERSWKSVGFEDEYQEQTYREAGREQLRAFVEKHASDPTLPLDMERHFALDLGDVVLEGRIDQINPAGQSDHAVELVDYKTGRPRSSKDAEKSLQLSVYALACRNEMKLKPARLTFYNLTNNEPVSAVRTDRDLEKVVTEIRAVAEQIRQQLFPAAPGFVCKWCDFMPICPAHEEEY